MNRDDVCVHSAFCRPRLGCMVHVIHSKGPAPNPHAAHAGVRRAASSALSRSSADGSALGLGAQGAGSGGGGAGGTGAAGATGTAAAQPHKWQVQNRVGGGSLYGVADEVSEEAVAAAEAAAISGSLSHGDSGSLGPGAGTGGLGGGHGGSGTALSSLARSGSSGALGLPPLPHPPGSTGAAGGAVHGSSVERSASPAPGGWWRQELGLSGWGHAHAVALVLALLQCMPAHVTRWKLMEWYGMIYTTGGGLQGQHASAGAAGAGQAQHHHHNPASKPSVLEGVDVVYLKNVVLKVGGGSDSFVAMSCIVLS